VILVDANLLVYAYVSSVPQHRAAKPWLDEKLNGDARVALPWPSLLGFLRLVTNPRVFQRPTSIGDAWTQVEEWLACPPVWTAAPTEAHASTLAGLIASAAPTGNLIPDVHLAALAIEHGLTLYSTDGDFARFAGLRWENPIA
jgi:toxin-antitoxin system PIN domain toxin